MAAVTRNRSSLFENKSFMKKRLFAYSLTKKIYYLLLILPGIMSVGPGCQISRQPAVASYAGKLLLLWSLADHPVITEGTQGAMWT